MTVIVVFVLASLLVIGTVGNLFSCFIFSYRTMLKIPAYFGFRLLAISDMVFLWCHVVFRWIPYYLQDLHLITNPIEVIGRYCAIQVFFMMAAASLNQLLLIVVSVGHCFSTCCCASTRRPLCCRQPCTWIWAVLLILLCLAAGLVAVRSKLYSTDSKKWCTLEVSEYEEKVDLSVCLPAVVLFILLLVLVIQIIFCRNKVRFELSLSNEGQVEDVDIGKNISFALIAFLIYETFLSVTACSWKFGTKFLLKDLLWNSLQSMYCSCKFLVYLLALPEYRRRMNAIFCPRS